MPIFLISKSSIVIDNVRANIADDFVISTDMSECINQLDNKKTDRHY